MFAKLWPFALTTALALTATFALAEGQNVIAYQPKLTLHVGESAVVHGVRGDCGQLPKSKKLKSRFLSNGKITYGKKGVRMSETCKGLTPAVEVVFVATKPGESKFEISNDIIRVTVIK